MSNQPQFLTDLSNGKTLVTRHLPTGQCQSFEWDGTRETMFVHTWNEKHPERGARTECENWKMGTLQLPLRQRLNSFETNY